MKSAIFHAPGDVRAGERPDPSIVDTTDAVVRIVRACVCGSDLWPYRGISEFAAGGPIGHECIGVVEDVGSDVRSVRRGDFVIVPFALSDGTCPHCRNGLTTGCDNLVFFPANGDGGQGEAARIPWADGSLVPVPGTGHSDRVLASLLTLSDVMATGHHAAVCARVRDGSTAVVVGDGAVGLCGVLAAKRRGADRIILMSRHADRQALGREFGATDIVEARGDEGVERVRELTRGVGADATLECVGTDQSMQTALAVTRPGGMVGAVGVPHDVGIDFSRMFFRNVGVQGGPAPARAYVDEFLDDVLTERINPGRVFDFTTTLDGIAEAYRVMDEREAIKSLLVVSSV